MPTYAYECTGCGNSFEAFQKMSDNPLTLCEVCGGALRKRMFPVGIVFKGSGFYVNDYGKKGSDSSSESSSTKAPDSAPASSETKTSEAKADTSTPAAAPKPAEKSAAETKAKA